jgi:serine/threonine protein kinase
MINNNEIFDRDYVLIKRIGRGGYAEVWMALHTVTDGTVVAIKILSPEGGLSPAAIAQFQREYIQTRNLNHQNLLRADHYAVVNHSPYIVMPFCEGGSLEDALANDGAFDEEKGAKILADTARGLSYLHQNNMIHNDIKPGNILISGNPSNDYLLSDFGISTRTRQTVQRESIGRAKMQENKTEEITGMAIAYAAPELFGENPISTPKSDVFSLGVSMYELATGQLPWQGLGGMLLRQGAAIPKLPETFSQRFNNIIRACLNSDPSQRPTAQDLEKWTAHYFNNQSWPDINPKPPQPITDNSKSNLPKWLILLVVGCIGLGFYWFSSKNKTNIDNHYYNQQLKTADSLLKYTQYETAIIAYKQALVNKNEDSITKKIEGIQNLVDGITKYNKGNYKTAAIAFQKASDSQIADGSYYLGELLNNGWGMKSDTVRGMKLTQKALAEGSNIAYWRVGYYNLNKNKQLSDQSFNLFLEYAYQYKEPVTNAMILLLYGHFYTYGWGNIKIDKKKAKQYFKRAAKLNCTQGIINLGYFLEDEGNKIGALEQFQFAAQLGDSLAKEQYLRLVKH